MNTAIAPSDAVQKKPDMFRTISQAALLTGTLDIIAANIHFYFDHQCDMWSIDDRFGRMDF